MPRFVYVLTALAFVYGAFLVNIIGSDVIYCSSSFNQLSSSSPTSAYVSHAKLALQCFGRILRLAHDEQQAAAYHALDNTYHIISHKSIIIYSTIQAILAAAERPDLEPVTIECTNDKDSLYLKKLRATLDTLTCDSDAGSTDKHHRRDFHTANPEPCYANGLRRTIRSLSDRCVTMSLQHRLRTVMCVWENFCSDQWRQVSNKLDEDARAEMDSS
jgi:hypothetical protein